MLNDEKLDIDSNHFRMGYSFGFSEAMDLNNNRPSDEKQNEIYSAGLAEGVSIGAEWAKIAMFLLVKDKKIPKKTMNAVIEKMNTMSGSEFELSRKEFCDFYKIDYKKYMENINERTVVI